MSLPSPEQNEDKPKPGTGQDQGDTQQAFAEAEVTQGSPVSIIPIAPMHWRILAFLLDGILVTLFAALLLTRVLLPEYHPVGYSQFYTLMSEHMEATMQAQAAGEAAPKLPDLAEQGDAINAMLNYGVEIFALCALVYFVFCERFMAGGSVGKTMLRLRVISLNTGMPPTIWESFLRGLVKVCPIVVPLFFVSYLLPFANRMRRAGHDWLARTLVVSDTNGYVPHVTPPRRNRDDEEEDY